MKVAYIKSLGGGLYLIAPVSPGHPDHELPVPPPEVGGGPIIPPGDGKPPSIPGLPDNSLPPMPTVPPGSYLVIYKGADGKWGWATSATVPTPVPPMAPGGVPQPKV